MSILEERKHNVETRLPTSTTPALPCDILIFLSLMKRNHNIVTRLQNGSLSIDDAKQICGAEFLQLAQENYSGTQERYERVNWLYPLLNPEGPEETDS